VHIRTAPAIVVINKIATSTIKKITTPGIHPGKAPMAPASVGGSVGNGEVGCPGIVGGADVVDLVGAVVLTRVGALVPLADGEVAEGVALVPVGALVG